MDRISPDHLHMCHAALVLCPNSAQRGKMSERAWVSLLTLSIIDLVKWTGIRYLSLATSVSTSKIRLKFPIFPIYMHTQWQSYTHSSGCGHTYTHTQNNRSKNFNLFTPTCQKTLHSQGKCILLQFTLASCVPVHKWMSLWDLFRIIWTRFWIASFVQINFTPVKPVFSWALAH
jgi:hypothetical protein